MSDPQPWLWYGFAAVTMASLVFLVFLWMRNGHQIGVVRKVLSLFVWMCLILVGWFSLKPQEPVLDEALLITEGAEADSVRELLQQLPPGISVFALPNAPRLEGVPHPITSVPDASWLRRNVSTTTLWHLSGWGLSEQNLQALAPQKLRFHPTASPLGFENCQWPRRLELGQAWNFRGRLNRPAPKGWRVALQAPSGELVDEQELAEDETAVLLGDRPALAGMLEYRLLLMDGNGTSQVEEVLPVFVTEPRRLEIWCLLGGPRFEIKFLKQFLGESGSSMMIRTRLTDTDWREEVINRDPLKQSIDRLPWDEADALLLDFAALLAMTPKARTSLKKAIENGLGVFLFPEDLASASEELDAATRQFFGDWQLKWQEEGIEQLLANLHWRGEFPLPKEKVEILPATLQLKKGQQVLADDGFGGILAASTRRSEGILAMSLVRHSQRWLMMGAMADFRSYWSHVLSRISRPVIPPPQMDFALPVQVDQPLSMTIWADTPDTLSLRNTKDQTPVSWASDALDFGRRIASFRPVDVGWQRVAWGEQGFDAFYVAPKRAWQTLRATRHMAATRQFVEIQQTASSAPAWRFLNLITLILGCFLLAVILLWLGEKFQRV